jgi:hypothetical protein
LLLCVLSLLVCLCAVVPRPDSLEKNSKTLMFVQVSPSADSSAESICSLRFAERVRKVELGKAEVGKKK